MSIPSRHGPGWRVGVALALALALVGTLGLEGCGKARPPAGPGDAAPPPAAPGTGSPLPGAAPPPAPSTPAKPAPLPPFAPLAAEGIAAVGPLPHLRAFGWLDERTAWGWGDRSPEQQVFLTLGVDGGLRAFDVPDTSYPQVLPDGSGFVGKHYPTATETSGHTAWYTPLEGQPQCLGPCAAVKLSPSGDFVIRFNKDVSTLQSLKTGESLPIPTSVIPHLSDGFAGTNTLWVDDRLLVVTLGNYFYDTVRLRFVGLPEASAIWELDLGRYPLPLLAPGGQWLAVLRIEQETLICREEAPPANVGRDIRVFSRPALSAPNPAPVAALGPPQGVVGSVTWSRDGTRLAFVTARGSSPHEGTGVAYEGPSQVVVASAPGFETEALPLEPGTVWLPAGFSPGGRYLVLQTAENEATPGRLQLWDFTEERAVPLPEYLEPWRLAWLGDRLLCCRTGPAAPNPWRLVLIDAATGRVDREIAWPALGALGEVSAGEWLVLIPSASQP